MNNNFTLILIFLIIIFVLFNDKLYEFKNLFQNTFEGLRNTFYFDNDSNYQYNMELEKKQCNSNDCQNDEDVLLVGKNSTNNHIFKHKNELYTVVNNKLILYNNVNDQISYFEFPSKVPTNLFDMTLKVKMIINGYNYIGVLNNNYYNQEYLLYEKPYNLFIDPENNTDNKLYYYILVKIINGKYTIIYELPPRSKILPQEYIWASYGSFQIGPLLFN
jgi:hypothetical protein